MAETKPRKSRRKISLGDRFNNLTFIREIPSNVGENRIGVFECECGNSLTLKISKVRNNAIKRCKDCLSRINSDSKRKYKINNPFTDMCSEFSSYALGLFFADGTVRKNSNNIEIALSEDDVDVLLKIKNVIQPEKPLYYCNVKNGRNQFKLAISNKDIKDIFIEYGCVENKSLILKYPNKKISHNHFIRGYIDGDGHISRKSLSIMGTKEFLHGLIDTINHNMDMDVKYRLYRKKNTKTNNYALIVCYISDREKILDWIYGDAMIYMNRKMEAYIDGYVKSSVNRGRNEKSRLKGSKRK